jgi:phage-related protein
MDVISFWERGVIYTAGRDYLYRPLVVIDFSRAGGLTLSEMDIKKALF